MPPSQITPREFVVAWNASATLDEACERTGMARKTALARYYRYRDVVQLKHLSARRTLRSQLEAP